MNKSAIVNYVLPPEKEKMIDISWEQFYYICKWIFIPIIKIYNEDT